MTKKDSVLSKILSFIEKYHWVFFLIILAVGMYLRFYRIESSYWYGWDQGRDAWKVRDILHGQHHPEGPHTGSGQINIGALQYYMLAPFFLFTNFDPIASQYLNILLNLVNFTLLYVVLRKISGTKSALLGIFIYTVSVYHLVLGKTPWNVTLMPGIAATIFYSVYKVYKDNNYKWILLAMTLCGLYWHIHFTALLIPAIIAISLIFVKDRKQAIKYYLLGIPLMLVWYIPNIFYEFSKKDKGVGKVDSFLDTFLLGFHARFFLHRIITDMFVQFRTLFPMKILWPFQYIIPAIYGVIIALKLYKNRTRETWLLPFLMAPWFIVPLFAWTFYAGHVSDYYMLYQVPMILIIIAYLAKKFFRWNWKIATPIILVLLVAYTYINTKDQWIKPTEGGLKAQKEVTRIMIREGKKIGFDEGKIDAYLYHIWTVDKIPME